MKHRLRTNKVGDRVVSADNAFRATLDILESPAYNRVYWSTTLGLIALTEMAGAVPHL
jgi:hypothetical protein